MTELADRVTDHADSPLARANATTVRLFFETVLAGERDLSKLPRFLSPGFIDHDPDQDDASPTGVTAKLEALWAALPNGHYRLLQLVAAGDLVTTRSLLEGGAIPVEFMDIYRVDAGLLVEHWHVVDGHLLAGALG